MVESRAVELDLKLVEPEVVKMADALAGVWVALTAETTVASKVVGRVEKMERC